MCGTQCPGRRTGPRGADHTLSGSANDRTKPQAASLCSGVSLQTRGAAAARLTVQQSARPGLLLGARVPCLRLLGPPRWLTPTEMRSLTALEVGSPKPGCQQWLLPGTLGEHPLPSPFPASDAAGNPGGGRGGRVIPLSPGLLSLVSPVPMSSHGLFIRKPVIGLGGSMTSF